MYDMRIFEEARRRRPCAKKATPTTDHGLLPAKVQRAAPILGRQARDAAAHGDVRDVYYDGRRPPERACLSFADHCTALYSRTARPQFLIAERGHWV